MRHPETETEARLLLDELGCQQSAGAQLSTGLLPVLIAVITVLVIGIVICFAEQLDRVGVKIEVGQILVAATLMFGVFQWRAALEKDALEKYQAEIKEANEKKRQWRSIPEFMRQHYPDAREHCFYVYDQLDNLEFALERYMRGFTSAYTASRAVFTFESKCQVPSFRVLAEKLLEQGSYSGPVKSVAVKVFQSTSAAATP